MALAHIRNFIPLSDPPRIGHSCDCMTRTTNHTPVATVWTKPADEWSHQPFVSPVAQSHSTQQPNPADHELMPDVKPELALPASGRTSTGENPRGPNEAHHRPSCHRYGRALLRLTA